MRSSPGPDSEPKSPPHRHGGTRCRPVSPRYKRAEASRSCAVSSPTSPLRRGDDVSRDVEYGSPARGDARAQLLISRGKNTADLLFWNIDSNERQPAAEVRLDHRPE